MSLSRVFFLRAVLDDQLVLLVVNWWKGSDVLLGLRSIFVNVIKDEVVLQSDDSLIQ